MSEATIAVAFAQVTDRDLVRSLRSTLCPSCGGAKTRNQTLCRREYFRLPVPMREALYNRLGDGYREAVFEAVNFLGAEQLNFEKRAEA